MRLGSVPLVAVLGVTLAAQQPSTPTFRSNVNAITLDVRVVDDHGQFVADLSKDEVQVFEDGVEQTLTAFSLVNIPVRADMRPREGTAPVDSDSASNDITTEQRLYILLLDDLRSEPTRSASIKAQARDFIEHRFNENDRAVVLTTSGRKGLVQEFTNNRKRLLDAVDKFEAGFDARVKCGSDSRECSCNDDRTAYQTLSGVAQWLVPVKGQRKSLLFFGEGDVSGGRASDPPSDIVDPLGAGDAQLAAWKANDPAVAGACGGIRADRLEAVDYAARANMSVYPVDPRRNADAEFARIVDDTSSYYLLGYVPTNDKRDGTFRKLEVRAKRPGLRATTRSGYTAPIDAPKKKKAPAESNPALTELMSTPVAAPGLTMAVTAPVFRGSKGKASVEVVVDVAGSDLAAASSGSRGVGKLDLLEAVADADGRVKASERGSLDMKLSDQTRQALADQGLRVMSRLDVPPGKYLLRVAGADGGGSSKGSVQYDLDVPDFSRDPITMSGLTLSLASEEHQPTTGSDKDWPKRFDHAPTARRMFRSGDELTIAGEAYINEKWDGPIQANTMVLRPSGDIAIQTHDTLGAGGPSTYRYDSTVALTDLEPGDYLFKVEVQTGDFTASREIPFAVTPGLAGVTYTTDPSLRDVLRRAGLYVAEFSKKVRGLVAEETYEQDAGGSQHRQLKSDFLLVQLPGWAHPVEFRDVFEVDGVPVRDREQRLARLFLTPTRSSTQIEEIVRESARYNIGRVQRSMNTPMLPLQFLGTLVQHGFDFRRTTDTKPMRVTKAETESGPFAVPENVWVIEFRETSKTTVIRNQQGRNIYSYGRYWIDPVSGRVLMSELRADGGGVSVVVDVSYRFDDAAGVAVPVEMRESYDPIQPGPGGVRGTATYGNFRQFSVQTDEAVAPLR